MNPFLVLFLFAFSIPLLRFSIMLPLKSVRRRFGIGFYRTSAADSPQTAVKASFKVDNADSKCYSRMKKVSTTGKEYFEIRCPWRLFVEGTLEGKRPTCSPRYILKIMKNMGMNSYRKSNRRRYVNRRVDDNSNHNVLYILMNTER